MRKIFFLLLMGLYANTFIAQENEATTYYFIRHAEKVRKDKTNKNPDLNKKGLNRAVYWSAVFKHVEFDLIYTTNYNRTIQTASPTAKSKNLEVQIYNPRELYSDGFKLKTKGKTVLVVGHSNTTPLFVNKVLGTSKYPEMDDNNNANLYIVTVTGEKIAATLLELSY